MGWGLSHKDAGRAAASWLIDCSGCGNALPIEGTKPKKNECAVRSGVFNTFSQHFCDYHPATITRKEFIEKMKNKKGG